MPMGEVGRCLRCTASSRAPRVPLLLQFRDPVPLQIENPQRDDPEVLQNDHFPEQWDELGGGATVGNDRERPGVELRLESRDLNRRQPVRHREHVPVARDDENPSSSPRWARASLRMPASDRPRKRRVTLFSLISFRAAYASSPVAAEGEMISHRMQNSPVSGWLYPAETVIPAPQAGQGNILLIVRSFQNARKQSLAPKRSFLQHENSCHNQFLPS